MFALKTVNCFRKLLSPSMLVLNKWFNFGPLCWRFISANNIPAATAEVSMTEQEMPYTEAHYPAHTHRRKIRRSGVRLLFLALSFVSHPAVTQPTTINSHSLFDFIAMWKVLLIPFFFSARHSAIFQSLWFIFNTQWLLIEKHRIPKKKFDGNRWLIV